MDYTNPELRQRLASEYVLGTLHGRARRRFEFLLEQDAQLRQLVSEWENKLGALHEGIEPIQPDKCVWHSIQQRLGLGREMAKESGLLNNLWNSLGLWRSVSVASSTLAIVLVLYLGLYTPKTIVVTQYIAVITNAQQQASWLARADINNRQLTVKVLNKQKLPLSKSFELWMLPDGGRAPVSMGLVSNSDDNTFIVSQAIITELSMAKGLAVSLEPEGGSPTGLPTGPVLYQGNIVSF